MNIFDKNVSKIILYPNPMGERTSIDLTGNKTFPLKVKITDLNGRIVRLTDYFNNHIIIERNNLKTGFYMIEVESDRKYIGKLMIK